MEFENFYLEIEGKEITDLYKDLISLEVELDENLAAMFRLRVPMKQEPEGTWSYLDDEEFRVWNNVVIKAGFEGEMEDLITGCITHVQPCFAPDPSKCVLEIWGMDESVRMDREEKIKSWPNKKDSDIAIEIIEHYKFTPVIEDTNVPHKENVSTIIQRETDMKFLKRLALRNGFECYAEGGNVYFRQPQDDPDPQPVLSYQFGGETNVECFSLKVDGLKPTQITMFHVDRVNKKVIDSDIDSSQRKALGSTDTKTLLANSIPPGKIYASMQPVTVKNEMDALCQGVFEKAQWFVTAEGTIAANRYGHVLKARKAVTIKGVGKTYSGVYYVSHVTHSFTPEGYFQYFKVKRNALMPTGSEDFSGSRESMGI